MSQQKKPAEPKTPAPRKEELSDDELDVVSGGGTSQPPHAPPPFFPK